MIYDDDDDHDDYYDDDIYTNAYCTYIILLYKMYMDTIIIKH